MAVMKKIATLTEIPRNDELKITDRASKLMQDVSRSCSEFVHARTQLIPAVAKCGRRQRRGT